MRKKFLKRRIAFLMALLLVPGSLSGCGQKPGEDESSDADEPANIYTPPVNKDGYIVVTMPIGSAEEGATFFWTSVAENEDGIPWALVVSVDKDLYASSELENTLYIRVNASVYMRLYQIFCGVPGNEWAVHMTVKDADSGEVISESDFPAREPKNRGCSKNIYYFCCIPLLFSIHLFHCFIQRHHLRIQLGDD